MKFAYIDESGSTAEGDVFVMAGLVIDAYNLRKATALFDDELRTFLGAYPVQQRELKTKAFINGNSNWSLIPAQDRKEFLTKICDLATQKTEIIAFGMSFQSFNGICKDTLPYKNYWEMNGMFISALIQIRAQKLPKKQKKKGLTVLIFDDNQRGMPKVSDGLYQADPWFDGLYNQKKNVRGNTTWPAIPKDKRFDYIVNTAFAIKSEHSSLIQIADAISYVYRHNLELATMDEKWKGEKQYFDVLAKKLDKKRVRLGVRSDVECVSFYKDIAHKAWKI